MEKAFSEIVIEGPFILVKGFLIGFRSALDEPFDYFFHRKTGIRRETLRDVMIELFELENVVHVCVEDWIVGPLREAIADAESLIGIRLCSVRHIESAEFRFSFEVYNQELAEHCEFLTEPLPSSVARLEYEDYGLPPEDDLIRLSGTSGAHPFVFGAHGVLQGDFGNVIELYLLCKRSEASEFIMTGEVGLELASEVEVLPVMNAVH